MTSPPAGLRYHAAKPIERDTAEAAFDGNDIDSICDALVRVSLHDPDWRYAQSACLTLSNHEDYAVRGLAATCLGHLARIHKQLDQRLVEAALRRLLADPQVAGRAADALEDIEIFMASGAAD